MPDPKAKTAIVTGASAPRGIGRACALRLARDGVNMVVTDIDRVMTVEGHDHTSTALLQELAAEITRNGAKAMALTLDVSDKAQIAEAIRQTATRFGDIDILVNNAGSLAGSDNFMSTTPQDWTRSFNVNLLGPMMMAQAVIPGMQRAGDGRIINIGSTGSLGAEPGFGAYAAMKHGLAGLSKTIAAEFGPDGIRCNTVCPGYIATDMHEAANDRLAREQGVSLSDIKAQRYAPIALRDAGTPEDVAEAVAYLAGPAGAYVTGINLPVTGGVPFGI